MSSCILFSKWKYIASFNLFLCFNFVVVIIVVWCCWWWWYGCVCMCVGLCWFVCMVYTHVFSSVSASSSHRGQRMPLGVLLYHSLASFLRKFLIECTASLAPRNPLVSAHDSSWVTGRCAAMPAFLCECWHLIVCGRVCLNNLPYSNRKEKLPVLVEVFSVLLFYSIWTLKLWNTCYMSSLSPP